DLGNETEVILEAGDDGELDEDDIAIEEEAGVSLEAEVDDQDEGQKEHNDVIAKTFRGKAIAMMAAKGVRIEEDEANIACQIFPRIAGLTHCVHDSAALKERFANLVESDESLAGSRRALSCCVPTCWNADLECLMAHTHFKDIVEQLTSIASLGLKGYQLSEAQWKMADDVQEILLLFDDVTKIFSTAEVPLIVDVIPTLEELREGLIGGRDDQVNKVSNTIRVACQAGILLIDKYSAFADDCDIYIIAIGIC
ncbi:hypothetical protein BDZ94DRAFT_1122863, partial [Collybia nuda]